MKLGSISHGTLRNEDLIPVLVRELQELKKELVSDKDKTAEDIAEAQRIEEFLAEQAERENEDGYFDSEDASEDVNEMMDILTDNAPPFVYFGSHEGDGSDFGYWISFDAVEQAVDAGELVRVDDEAAIEDADTTDETEFFGVFDPQDNLTALYDLDGGLVWEV